MTAGEAVIWQPEFPETTQLSSLTALYCDSSEFFSGVGKGSSLGVCLS
jgi:hypothetical protein